MYSEDVLILAFTDKWYNITHSARSAFFIANRWMTSFHHYILGGFRPRKMIVFTAEEQGWGAPKKCLTHEGFDAYQQHVEGNNEKMGQRQEALFYVRDKAGPLSSYAV